MASEQQNKRIKNQYAVLRALHLEGPLQRGEISAKYNIRKSSITSIVSGLIELGIVTEETPGYMRSRLALDTQNFHVLVGHLSPTHLTIARIYLDGRAESMTSHPIQQDGPEVLIPKIAALLKAEIATIPPTSLLGIGLAIPGILQSTTGHIINAVNLAGWRDIDLGTQLENLLDHHVFIENDTRCQLWSNIWFDKLGCDSDSVMYLEIDFGVSCAVITNDIRIVGAHASAGEIGQIQLENGNTLKAVCSTPALIAQAQVIDPSIQTATDLITAATSQKKIADGIEAAITKLSFILSGAIAAIDPQVIVLGTGDEGFSHYLKQLLEPAMLRRMHGIQNMETEFKVAADVENSSLRGIAGLVIDRSFKKAQVLQDTRVRNPV